MGQAHAELEAPPPGTQIGRYQVLESLGAGANGVVVSALDTELGRKVAIKLLHNRRQDSGRARARLLREAKALARLSHPNVTRIHDIGTYEDRVFMAMEQVEGVTLREWLDSDARTLSEILDVFIAAGSGLAAAHQAGLVHRDFKPDNVLIGEDGEVRVADFGLVGESASTDDSSRSLPPMPAPDLDATDLTQSGPLAGTPAYMSPEQMEGRSVDPRSDQFSFCVTLHEALYGHRPFEGETLDELHDSVKSEQIKTPVPSLVPRSVRRAVERGLSFRSVDRHASMEHLLVRLRRRGLRRWTAVGMIGIPLCGIGVALGSIEPSRNESTYCSEPQNRLREVWGKDRASALSERFQSAPVPYAAETWTTVRVRLDAYAVEWQAATADACRAREAGIEPTQADRWITCLHGRLERLRSYANLIDSAEPDIVEHAVEALDALGTVSSCRLAGSRIQPFDSEFATGEALSRAQVLRRAGRYEEAAEQARTARDAAFERGDRAAEAAAALELAEALSSAGEHAESEDTFHQALSAAMASGDSNVIAACAAALAGVAALEGGRDREARRWIEHAEGAAEAVHDDPDLQSKVATSRGIVEAGAGDYAAATQAFQQSLAIKISTHGDADISLATVYDNLCSMARRQSKYEEAIVHCESSLKIRKGALGSSHPRVSRNLSQLCAIAMDMGQPQRAIDLCSEALDIARENYKGDHPALGGVLLNYGSALHGNGQLDEAEQAFLESARVAEGSAATRLDYARAIANLGTFYQMKEEFEKGAEYTQRAYEIYKEHRGADHPVTILVASNLANVWATVGRKDEAIELAKQTLATQEAKLGADHVDLASTHGVLGVILLDTGRAEEATKHLERALAIFEQHGVMPHHRANTRRYLGMALFESGQKNRGKSIVRQAIKELHELGPVSRQRAADAEAWLKEN